MSETRCERSPDCEFEPGHISPCGKPVRPGDPCEFCGDPQEVIDGQVQSCPKCWVRIEDMAPADIRALFAEDGTFSVGTDGRLTIAKPLEDDRG
jgi:hypothetical protein